MSRKPIFVSDQLIDAVIRDIQVQVEGTEPNKEKEIRRLARRFDAMMVEWFHDSKTPTDLEQGKALIKRLKKMPVNESGIGAEVWQILTVSVHHAMDTSSPQ